MQKEIIVLMQYLGNSGVERVQSLLMNEWVRLGCHVTILLRDSIMFDHDFDLSDKISVLSLRGKGNNKLIRRTDSAINLAKYLNRHKNATVVVFLDTMMRLLGPTLPFISNKVVFAERNDPNHSPYDPLFRSIRNFLYTKADVCVFQTREAQSYFKESIQKKSTIIPNPINPQLLDPYVGAREKKIICACRFTEQKNIPMLLNAFSKFSRKHPDFDLYIYGRGPLKDDMEKMSNNLGIGKRTHFPDFASDILRIMNTSMMYVSSSDYEGISNSMLEALGMGVPTICTDCPVGGAREMIEDGVNGILVPVGDVDALSSAMMKIVENPEFAESLSKEAAKIRGKYPIEEIAKRWLAVM